MKTISIKVTGKVQGVWYRKYTVEKSVELGINGYVKNMPDKTVYILATGTQAQLNALVEWCYTGSPKSSVEQVETKEEELKMMTGFRSE